ncbi:MAG: hypothetical protein KatS3mg113_0985 [Planctomycetaceae bacterium]|nr:MAG: hypothetical protein KatS3mg113_0985 [Planctomycetaceae bacterium]
MTATLLEESTCDVVPDTPTRLNWLSFDPQQVLQHFNQRPFLIEHRLCDHPLFELERLLALCRQLPVQHVEYNAGNLPVNQDQALTPRNGLSAEETIRRIRDCQSWMVLKWVEYDPEYRQLLHECLAELRPYTEQVVPGMRFPQAFIFITSPHSVTPYHIDPEHNFLLQIRGNKYIRLYDGSNRELLPEEDLERFYALRVRNLVLKDEYRERCWLYDLQPGQGLHFPVTYPHWVQNGADVSISFSITFRTPDLERRRQVYQVNHWLRKQGWRGTPYGQSWWKDQMKYQTLRVIQRLSRFINRGS